MSWEEKRTDKGVATSKLVRKQTPRKIPHEQASENDGPERCERELVQAPLRFQRLVKE